MRNLLDVGIYEDLLQKHTTENEAISDNGADGMEARSSDGDRYKITEWKKQSFDNYQQFSINNSFKAKAEYSMPEKESRQVFMLRESRSKRQTIYDTFENSPEQSIEADQDQAIPF